MNTKGFKDARGSETINRILYMPTIFEHSAKLINKTPSKVALDENLMEEAHIKAYKTYGHDSVTVGIDVYNIEAEALGCKVKYYDDYSMPGIISHPYHDNFNLSDISFSLNKGRIKKLLNAATNVKKSIGDEVSVNLGISGPFSISVELIGYENMIMECLLVPEKIKELLWKVLEFQKNYCDEILERGIGITIFESWASPPLVSPEVYREFVNPFEKKLIDHIKNNGVCSVPLVIGGDTTPIVDDIIDTGTTLLVADYKVDMDLFLEKAIEKSLFLRRNIDPKIIEKEKIENILVYVEKAVNEAKEYKKFILGTGVIPYNTPSESILAVKNYLDSIISC